MRYSCFWVEMRGNGRGETKRVAGWLDRLTWRASQRGRRRRVFSFGRGERF